MSSRWRVVPHRLLASVIMLGVLASVPTSASQRSGRCDECATRSTVPPAFEKLGRGMANTAGGWLEIPLTMHQNYTEQDTGTSLAAGAVHGIVKGIVRTGVGVYEIVTFWLPLPKHFAPILPTLEYYNHLGKTPRPLPLE